MPSANNPLKMTLNLATFSARLKFAGTASLMHLVGCLIIAGVSFALVLGIWYPHQYQEMSAGRELFFLLTGVDVVIGPLLTLVLFTPEKSRKELRTDLAMVVVCQLSAFIFGMYTVYHARPLFLVAEVDRFKTISAVDLREADLAEVPEKFKPKFFTGPRLVFAQTPTDPKEQLALFEESFKGGPDIGEKPKYYIEYDQQSALKMLGRARPLSVFLKDSPVQEKNANSLTVETHRTIADLRFLPVMARADWVAVLDPSGAVVGFLEGDGFKTAR